MSVRRQQASDERVARWVCEVLARCLGSGVGASAQEGYSGGIRVWQAWLSRVEK